MNENNTTVTLELTRLSHASDTMYQTVFGSKIIYSEGVQMLCEKANCYWLIDLIASHTAMTKTIPNDRMVIWHVEPSEKKSHVKITACHDISEGKKEKIYFEQELWSTMQFSGIDGFNIYVADGIIYMPSEH